MAAVSLLVFFWCSSGVLLGSFWCSSGVLLVFFWCSITQKNTRRTQKNPEELWGKRAPLSSNLAAVSFQQTGKWGK